MGILAALGDFFIELKKNGIKKGDVAKKLGITESYLSKMISGEKPTTDSFISGLHKYYGDHLKRMGLNLKKLPEEEDIDAEHEEIFNTKVSLEKSIEYLTKDKLKTSELIERLVIMMEKKYVDRIELNEPGRAGTKTELPTKQKTGT